MTVPGRKEKCPPNVNTCQKFVGSKFGSFFISLNLNDRIFLCYFIEIDGKYTRLHMCGMPKETASFEDDCQQKIFQSKDGQQLDGTFCECGSVGCNESSKIVPLDKVFFLLMSLMYIRKLILSKTITSNI